MQIVPAALEISELEASQVEAEGVDDSALHEKMGGVNDSTLETPEMDAANISEIGAPEEGEMNLLADEPDEF